MIVILHYKSSISRLQVDTNKIASNRVWLNLPDLRTFDFLAQKQTLITHVAKTSKCKKILPLHEDSMASFGPKFKTVKCSWYHTSKRRVDVNVIKSILPATFYHMFGTNAAKTHRNCARGKDSFGLTLMRLHSAKDQWVGQVKARTGSRCAPARTRTGDGEPV